MYINIVYIVTQRCVYIYLRLQNIANPISEDDSLITSAVVSILWITFLSSLIIKTRLNAKNKIFNADTQSDKVN